MKRVGNICGTDVFVSSFLKDNKPVARLSSYRDHFQEATLDLSWQLPCHVDSLLSGAYVEGMAQQIQVRGRWAGSTGGWRPAIDGVLNQTGKSAEEASTFEDKVPQEVIEMVTGFNPEEWRILLVIGGKVRNVHACHFCTYEELPRSIQKEHEWAKNRDEEKFVFYEPQNVFIPLENFQKATVSPWGYMVDGFATDSYFSGLALQFKNNDPDSNCDCEVWYEYWRRQTMSIRSTVGIALKNETFKALSYEVQVFLRESHTAGDYNEIGICYIIEYFNNWNRSNEMVDQLYTELSAFSSDSYLVQEACFDYPSMEGDGDAGGWTDNPFHLRKSLSVAIHTDFY